MVETPAPPKPQRSTPWRWVAAAAVAVVVVVVAVALFVANRDDDDDVASVPSDTTATTDAPTTPATLTDEEAATVVWPAPGDGQYTQPADAVRSFAEDLVGFTDPTLGEFQAGDSRSGEVEVTTAGGPVTTVVVRNMSDGFWYVTGSAASGFQLTDPIAGTAIDHPLIVDASASTPIDAVHVAVHARGTTDALGEGDVPATTTDPLSFHGEVAWDNPGGGWGAVVATTGTGGGEIAQAVAVPVGFIGGD